jgi:hypothetical protein
MKKNVFTLKYVVAFVCFALLSSCDSVEEVKPENVRTNNDNSASLNFKGLTVLKPNGIDSEILMMSKEQSRKYFEKEEIKSLAKKLVNAGENMDDIIKVINSLDVPHIDFGNISQSDIKVINKYFPEIKDANDIFQNKQIIGEYLNKITSQKILEYYKNNVDKISNSQKKSSKTTQIANWHEAWLALWNPNAAAAMYSASNYAINYSEQELGRLGGGDTRRDALRHSVWNFMGVNTMCVAYGFDEWESIILTIAFANAHEYNETALFNTTDYARVMDLRNNAIGIQQFFISHYDIFQGIGSLREKAKWVNAAFVNTNPEGWYIGSISSVVLNDMSNQFNNNKLIYINNSNDIPPCGFCLIQD